MEQCWLGAKKMQAEGELSGRGAAKENKPSARRRVLQGSGGWTSLGVSGGPGANTCFECSQNKAERAPGACLAAKLRGFSFPAEGDSSMPSYPDPVSKKIANETTEIPYYTHMIFGINQ